MTKQRPGSPAKKGPSARTRESATRWTVRLVATAIIAMFVFVAPDADNPRSGIDWFAYAVVITGAVGAVLYTVKTERLKNVGGLLIGLSLYIGFTVTGLSLILDPAAAIAHQSPGPRRLNLETEGEARLWGAFFLGFFNGPILLYAGAIVWSLLALPKKPPTPPGSTARSTAVRNRRGRKSPGPHPNRHDRR